MFFTPPLRHVSAILIISLVMSSAICIFFVKLFEPAQIITVVGLSSSSDACM